MSVSYVSSVTDIPGVQTAISHLQDLQYHMGETTGFKTSDTSHIDVIIQCIQDLERERSKAHELLETETIKASVLRHKLQYFPDEIKKEISDAVGAARRDNEEELASLNKELNQINVDITDSSIKLKQLDEKNAFLHPERDRVRSENEEVIAMLNERMSEKASKQIILNDTRDVLRDTNQKIVDLEEGLVILKEDLIQERNDHRIEKNRIKGLTTEASNKTRDQKHNNAVKKLELTNLRDQYGELSADFTALRTDTERLDKHIEKLSSQEAELVEQLRDQIRANEKLKQKGIELDQHGVQMDKDFEERKSQALKKIGKLNRDIDSEKERGDALEGNRNEVESEYQAANEVRKNYETKVAELKEQLQRAQDTYKSRVEDVGRLTQDNQDMETRRIQLAEEHEMLVRNLNNEIAAEREKLNMKRKERMALQTERETSQKSLTDLRGDQQKYMRDMNKQITGLKNQHDQLTEEGRTLNKVIKQDDKETVEYTNKLADARARFDLMKESLEFAIKRLQETVSRMEVESETKQQLLIEKTPIFQALEAEHDATAESFDQIKKSIVALKNKKNGLDDAVQRNKREIEKLDLPRKAANDELDKQRQLTLHQHGAHADRRQLTERELYSVGVKLKTVLEENDRFTAAIKSLCDEKDRILRQLEAAAMKKDGLLMDLYKEREELLNAWMADQEITEKTAARDNLLVDQFTDLLNRTDNRQKILNSVSLNLHEELDKLGKFLRNVSSKRPKDIRKELKEMTKRNSSNVTGTPGTVVGGATGLDTPRYTRPASQVSSLVTVNQKILPHPPGVSKPRSNLTTPRSAELPSQQQHAADTIRDKF